MAASRNSSIMSEGKKVLAIDYSRCTGCHLCELACSIKNEGVVNPLLSRITVQTLPESPVSIPRTCMQCRDAPCMRVCPVNAITFNSDTGAYVINQDKCIGCYACAYACPFGAILINREAQFVKCDLCSGDPECVRVCPTGALIYGPADEVVSEINRRKAVSMATMIDTEEILVRKSVEAVEKAREAVRTLYRIWEKVRGKST